MDLGPIQSERLMQIARDAIRRTLSGEPVAKLNESDPVLLQPAGCFVSLHDLVDQRLRGCIGRIEADRSLAEAVQQSAVGVLRDPRFERMSVRLEELSGIEIEISVLSPLVQAQDPLDFDPLNEGIYLTVRDRIGCFLPQVARQTGWGKEQLLDRLCSEKLGLAARAWREPGAELRKFTVMLIGPMPFVPLD